MSNSEYGEPPLKRACNEYRMLEEFLAGMSKEQAIRAGFDPKKFSLISKVAERMNILSEEMKEQEDGNQ